jgi:hypothetical protein
MEIEPFRVQLILELILGHGTVRLPPLDQKISSTKNLQQDIICCHKSFYYFLCPYFLSTDVG